MKDGNWISIVLGLLGFGLTITITLIGIIFSWLKARIDRNEEKADKDIREFRQHMQDRLRTLGHEDREIRGNIDDLHQIFIEYIATKKTDYKRKGD